VLSSAILYDYVHDMFTARQMKAARALLGWEQKKLAELSGVSLPTIKRMELYAGRVGGHARNVYAVLDAFERAGIEFLNGDAPGVRLRKPM
jgi:predicted transcriptional regulator